MYRPELSEATRLASNDAFRDHWGSQPQNEEVWEKHRSVSIARDDLSFVAIGTNAAGEEEVAGYVITVVQPDDFEGQGFSSSYVELVGTRREWRGQRHCAGAAHARARGLEGRRSSTRWCSTWMPRTRPARWGSTPRSASRSRTARVSYVRELLSPTASA